MTKTSRLVLSLVGAVLISGCAARGVRIAELKSRENEPPTLEGEGYRLAVYGLPGGYFKGDPKKLGDPLKGQAVLRREGKKDVRPIAVEVFRRDNGFVVVYLFPLSAEINPKDQVVLFEARIGRIVPAVERRPEPCRPTVRPGHRRPVALRRFRRCHRR